jgi:hypothetical protein
LKASIISAAIAVTALGALAISRMAAQNSVPAQPQNNSAKTQHESPFACNLMALTPEQSARHFLVLGPALRPLRKSVRELADGYEFEFPADQKTFQMVTEWAMQERLCCPFFDIEVRLERDGGPLWLRLTGREGAKDFIKADGAAWIEQ